MVVKSTYVWTDVLTDYTSGMAVVEAPSKESAFAKVRRLRDQGEVPGPVANELLSTDPEELDGIEWVYGGA